MTKLFIEVILETPELYIVRVGNWTLTREDNGESEWEWIGQEVRECEN